MFSGIVEVLAKVEEVVPSAGNTDFFISAPFIQELKIDQSIAHNGTCLTVVEIREDRYRVTAIEETLKRTNLGLLKSGMYVNLERCLKLNDRLDGHLVQGHVDCVGTCMSKEDIGGSWKFHFSYTDLSMVTVAKGSITVNGVSLTVVDSSTGEFSVCIIPYTYENTNFHALEAGQKVNLEFDVIGKYVMRYMELQNK